MHSKNIQILPCVDKTWHTHALWDGESRGGVKFRKKNQFWFFRVVFLKKTFLHILKFFCHKWYHVGGVTIARNVIFTFSFFRVFFSYIFDFRSLNSCILLKTTLTQQRVSKYMALPNLGPNPPNARTVQTNIF